MKFLIICATLLVSFLNAAALNISEQITLLETKYRNILGKNVLEEGVTLQPDEYRDLGAALIDGLPPQGPQVLKQYKYNDDCLRATSAIFVVDSIIYHLYEYELTKQDQQVRINSAFQICLLCQLRKEITFLYYQVIPKQTL